MTERRDDLLTGALSLVPPFDGLGAVCPRCRRLVAPHVPCVLDGASPLDARDDAQREQLVEAMWGSPAERAALEAARIPAKAQRLRSSLVGGAATLMVMMYAQVETALALAASSFSAVAFGALTGTRGRLLVPGDATPLPVFPVVGRGRIESAPPLTAPGSGSPCAAWALELRHEGHGGTRTTLRVGASGGFDVHLDGGERVRVEAGALWLEGTMSQVDDEDGAIADLLRVLDPRAALSAWPLFSYNVIRELTLPLTATVEVRGQVASRPLQDQEGLTYREAAPSVLVPVGLPVLRRVSP